MFTFITSGVGVVVNVGVRDIVHVGETVMVKVDVGVREFVAVEVRVNV